ncbi:MAG: AraC family transcriptional regulator [Kiritimatiellae bacterium]|nr:AraC family transcriptional regulator [Kiritimatiellia bacterium]MDD5523196.1 AraC family transcriptional regulator [Kiritimatiellia bacterium]
MLFDQSTYDGVNILWDNRRIRTPNVTFGEVRYKPGGFVGPRIQRNYQLVILHSGSCQVTVDESQHNLTPGWVSLYTPKHREYFLFSMDAETHHTWCHLNPNFTPPGLKRQLVKAPFSIPCSDAFKHLHAAAFKLRPPIKQNAGNLIDQLGLSLFFEYLIMAQEQSSHSRHDAAVNNAIRHMEEHFGDKDCLQSAQKISGVSQNALIYKFNEELNTTPARYLWKLRTEQGVAMLGETGLSIAEIAYRCGFKNPYHFSRLVKTLQGSSPRKVRRHAWSGKRS